MKNKKRRHWAEVKKKENRFKKINYSKIIYRLLAIIFIGVVVYSFIFSTFLEISSVSIIGLNKISAKEAYQLIDELKSGKYFGIVPKNNFLFLRSKKIVQQFEDKFKRIDTMEVIKKFPHKLEIRINERNTLLIVCSGGNCYFVDKKGVAYAKA
ncbi:MAG TPA: FtsQ-type POTRA domain-containing protein, partial [Candidatus Moranbacteria bacterium]|nr:FtsQ-type POTRA domain-containing protein [Candidatus Moranbacteria bacterium]